MHLHIPQNALFPGAEHPHRGTVGTGQAPVNQRAPEEPPPEPPLEPPNPPPENEPPEPPLLLDGAAALMVLRTAEKPESICVPMSNMPAEPPNPPPNDMFDVESEPQYIGL